MRQRRPVPCARKLIGWCAGLLVLLLTGVTGCADADASNYITERVGKLVVDRPRAWSIEISVEQPWSKGFRLTPDSVEQIQLSGDFGEFVTAAQAMGTLIGQAQVNLHAFEIVQSRDVKIKGATTGQITRYTMRDNAGSQLFGEWIVAAHWPYPQSVAVSILTRQFDPDLERRVVDSMELRPLLQ